MFMKTEFEASNVAMSNCELVGKWSGYIVIVDSIVAAEHDTRCLHDIESVICIKSIVNIPITGDDGMRKQCEMKVTDTIKDLVENNFGVNVFAFTSNGRVLNMDSTIKEEGFHETNGFLVKSWCVDIRTEHQFKKKENLKNCAFIRDVVAKLGGCKAYYKEQELDPGIYVVDFIKSTPSDRYIFISVQHNEAAIFSFEQSVSIAAREHNGKAILQNTIEYGIYSHWLAVRIYDNWAYSQDVKAIVENFQAILRCQDDDVLLIDEQFYTSLLSSALDTFLVDFCCLHQMPVKHQLHNNFTYASLLLHLYFTATSMQSEMPLIGLK